MTTIDTYEADFLRLASREGMEGLRQKCPECNGLGGFIERCGPTDVEQYACPSCMGMTWLPLPEAERLGALVRVALAKGCRVEFEPCDGGVLFYLDGIHDEVVYLTPEAALVAAMEVAA